MLLYYLWEFIVDIWSFIVGSIDDRRRWKGKERQRIGFYLSLDADELQNLPDIELFATPYEQLTRKHFIHRVSALAELERFNSVQQVFWALDTYEQACYSGGILAFLTSKYRYVTPILLSAMETVGAVAHMELLRDFMERNRIEPNELSDFDLSGLKPKDRNARLAELKERYGVSAFDEEYRAIEPIEGYMIPYIRENAEMLLAEVPKEERRETR